MLILSCSDPSAINTISTAGVLGEQHASRLCTKQEPVEPYCSTYLKSWTKTTPKLPLPTDYLKTSCAHQVYVCSWLSAWSWAEFFPHMFSASRHIKQYLPSPPAFTWLHLQEPRVFSKGHFDPQTHASTTLRWHHVALESWGVTSVSLNIWKD